MNLEHQRNRSKNPYTAWAAWVRNGERYALVAPELAAMLECHATLPLQ